MAQESIAASAAAPAARGPGRAKAGGLAAPRGYQPLPRARVAPRSDLIFAEVAHQAGSTQDKYKIPGHGDIFHALLQLTLHAPRTSVRRDEPKGLKMVGILVLGGEWRMGR